jgi:hypothetical protein
VTAAANAAIGARRGGAAGTTEAINKAIASKNPASEEFQAVDEDHKHCCINFVPKVKPSDKGWEVTCCNRCQAAPAITDGKEDKCLPLSKIEQEDKEEVKA